MTPRYDLLLLSAALGLVCGIIGCMYLLPVIPVIIVAMIGGYGISRLR